MSNLVLYRKYRPLKFSDAVSQEHVRTTLTNAVINNRVGHAYLFTGPRGVGKTTMARILARAVNCPNMKDGEPCNECDMCKELLGNTSLDIIEIDAASHTGVDNIRELIDHLQFSPARAKYKVIIVDEVHMLSKGAFNALLKTLEEPPAHAIFILATTEIHKVPATIISRTQRFDFKKVSVADLVKLLKFVSNDNKIKISEEAVVEIAHAADGGFRDGLSLLDQVITYSNGEITETLVEEVLGLTGIKTLIDFLYLLIKNETKSAVNFISDLMYQGRDLFQFQKDFLEYLRKVLLVKVGNSAHLEYAAEVKQSIMDQANQLPQERLIKIIEQFTQAGSELKWASIPSLPLELASVKASDAVQQIPAQVATIQKPIQTVSSSSESLDKIVSLWQAILDKTKEYNHSLVSTLKLAQPVAVQGLDLVLIVPYKFHKDTIEARKNRIIIDQVIEEVAGVKVICKPMLSKDWTGEMPSAENSPEETKSNLVESTIKIMGGGVE